MNNKMSTMPEAWNANNIYKKEILMLLKIIFNVLKKNKKICLKRAIHLIVNSSIIISSFIVIIRWHLQYISNKNKYSFNCQLIIFPSFCIIL